jgi:hypothetical protein
MLGADTRSRLNGFIYGDVFVAGNISVSCCRGLPRHDDA